MILMQTKKKLSQYLKLKMVENLQKYDSIIIAVAHDEFKKLNFKSLKKSDNSIIYDIKGFLKNQK